MGVTHTTQRLSAAGWEDAAEGHRPILPEMGVTHTTQRLSAAGWEDAAEGHTGLNLWLPIPPTRLRVFVILYAAQSELS